jgi:hypothetical protein
MNEMITAGILAIRAIIRGKAKDQPGFRQFSWIYPFNEFPPSDTGGEAARTLAHLQFVQLIFQTLCVQPSEQRRQFIVH